MSNTGSPLERVGSPTWAGSPATPSGRRNRRSRKLMQLEAELATERFDRTYLQEELTRKDVKVQEMEKLHTVLASEISHLRDELGRVSAGGDGVGGLQGAEEGRGCEGHDRLHKDMRDLEQELLKAIGDLTSVTQERDTLRNKMTEMDKDVTMWRKQVVEYEATKELMQETLNDNKFLISSLKMELAENKRILEVLRQEQLLNESIECDDDTLSLKRTFNSSFTGPIENLGSAVVDVQLKEQTHRNSVLSSQIEDLIKENSTLTQQLGQCRGECKELTTLTATLKDEINNFKELLETSEKDLSSKVNELTCITEGHKKLQDLVKKQEDDLCKLNQDISDKVTQFNLISEEKMSLENNLKNSQISIDNFIEKTNANMEVITRLTKNVKAVEKNNCILKKEKNNVEIELNKTVQSLTEEITSTKTQLQVNSELHAKVVEENSEQLQKLQLKLNDISNNKTELESLLNEVKSEREVYLKLSESKQDEVEKLSIEIETINDVLHTNECQVESLKGEVNRLDVELSGQVELNNGLTRQIDDHVNEKNLLQQKLNESNDKYQDLSNSNLKLNDEITSFKDVLNTSQEALTLKIAEVSSVAEENKSLQKLVKEQGDSLNKLDQDITDKITQLSLLNEENTSLANKLQSCQVSIEKHVKKTKVSKEVISELTVCVKALENENSVLIKEKNNNELEYSKTVQSLTEDIQSTRTQLQINGELHTKVLAENMEQLERLQETLREISKDKTELQSLLSNVKAEVVVYQNKLETKQEEVQKLTMEVETLSGNLVINESNINSLTEEVKHLEDGLSERSQHIDCLTNQIDGHVKEKISLQQDLKEANNNEIDMKNSVTLLTEKINNTLIQLQDSRELHVKEMTESFENLEKLQDALKEISNDKIKLENQLQEVKSEKEVYQKKSEAKQEEAEKLSVEIQTLNNVVNTNESQVMSLKQEVNHLSVKLSEKVQHADCLTSQIDDHINEKNLLQQELKELNDKYQNLSSSNLKLSDEIKCSTELMESLKQDLSSKINEITLLSNEKNSMQVHLEKQENNLSHVNQDVTEKINELNLIKEEKVSLEKKVEDCQITIENYMKDISANSEIITDLTENVNILQNKNLIYIQEKNESEIEYKNTVKLLTEEIETMKTVLQDNRELHTKYVTDTSEQLEKLQTKIKDISNEKIVLEIELCEMKSENKLYQNKTESKQDEIEKVSLKIETLNDQLCSKENQVKSLIDEVSHLGEELSGKVKHINCLTSQIDDHVNEKNSLQQELKESNDKYQDLSMSNSKLNDEITNFKDKLETSQKDIKSKITEVSTITEEIESLQNLAKKQESDICKLDQAMSEKLSQFNQMNEEKTELDKKLQSCQITIENHIRETNINLEVIIELTNNVRTLEKDNSTLVQEKNISQIENSNAVKLLNENISHIQTQLHETGELHSEKMAENAQELDHLQNALKEISNYNTELQNQLQEVTSEREIYQNKSQSKQDEVDKLSMVNETLKKELLAIVCNTQTLDDKMSILDVQLRDQMEHNNSLVSLMENINKEKEILTQQLAESANECHTLTASNKELNIKITNLMDELDSLKRDFSSKLSEMSLLIDEKMSMQILIERQQRDLDQLNQDVKEKITQTNEIKHEKVTLEKNIEVTQISIENYVREITTKSEIITDLTTKLKTLQDNDLTLVQEKTASDTEYNKIIQSLTEEVKNTQTQLQVKNELHNNLISEKALELENLQMKLKEILSDKTELENKFSKMKSEKDIYQNMLDSKQNEMDQCIVNTQALLDANVSNIRSLNERTDNLDLKLKDMAQLNDNLVSQVKDLNTEKETLTQQLEKSIEHVKTLETTNLIHIQEKNNNEVEYNNTVKLLTEEIENIQTHLQVSGESLNQKVTENNVVVEKLQQTLKVITMEKTELQNQLHVIISEVESCQNQLQSKCDEVDILSNDVCALNEKLTANDATSKSLHEKLNSLEIQLKDQTHLNHTLNKLIEEKNSLHDGKSVESTQKIEQFQQEFEKLSRDKSELVNQLREFKSENELNQNQLQIKQNEVEDLMIQNQALKLKLATNENNIKSLDEKLQSCNDLDIQLREQINRKETVFKEELEIQQNNLLTYTKEITLLKQEKMQMNDLIKKHEDNLCTANEEITMKTSELTLVKGDLHRKLVLENMSLKKQISSLTFTIDEVNTKYSTQIDDLMTANENLRAEIKKSQVKTSNGDPDQLVADMRNEYEDKLTRMKQKMKQLYQEQIAVYTEKQKEDIASLEATCKKYSEKISRYEVHVNHLMFEQWKVGEKLLNEKKENDELRKKVAERGSQQSLNSVTSTVSLPHTKFEMRRNLNTRVPQRRPNPSPIKERHSDFRPRASNKESGGLHMSDEEGEVFDNTYLTELRAGVCEPRASSTALPGHGGRLSELQYRNSLCLPHLKSSYPAESQFHRFKEDEIKLGTINLDDSVTVEKPRSKKEAGQTSYHKPGPPTPSKNGGRLSMGNDIREPLKEYNDNTKKTTTPSRIKSLFMGNTSKSSSRDENTFGTPKGRRLSIFRKPR